MLFSAKRAIQKRLTLGVRSNRDLFFHGFLRLATCTNSAFFSHVADSGNPLNPTSV
jgi:hypothetical protein